MGSDPAAFAAIIHRLVDALEDIRLDASSGLVSTLGEIDARAWLRLATSERFVGSNHRPRCAWT